MVNLARSTNVLMFSWKDNPFDEAEAFPRAVRFAKGMVFLQGEKPWAFGWLGFGWMMCYTSNRKGSILSSKRGCLKIQVPSNVSKQDGYDGQFMLYQWYFSPLDFEALTFDPKNQSLKSHQLFGRIHMRYSQRGGPILIHFEFNGWMLARLLMEDIQPQVVYPST